MDIKAAAVMVKVAIAQAEERRAAAAAAATLPPLLQVLVSWKYQNLKQEQEQETNIQSLKQLLADC